MSLRARTRLCNTQPDASQVEDVTMVRRYLSGDERAFDELHSKYRRRLIHFITKMTHDVSRAEDLVQEVFLRVFRHLKDFDTKRRFSTWIHMIAKRIALNEIRNKKRRTTISVSELAEEIDEDALFNLEDKKLGPDTLLNGREASRTLELALKALPYRRRRMFILRELQGKQISEVAETMHCPTGTVKSGLNRAIRIMTPIVRKRMV